MQKTKLLLFDIDGTIRGHHKDGDVIHERLLPLLLELKSRGYELAVVTGRPYLFYKEFVVELLENTGLGEEQLPFDFIIYENGHRIYKDAVHMPLIREASRQEMEQFRSLIASKLQTTGTLWSDGSGLPVHANHPREAFRGETYISLVDLAKELPEEDAQSYGDLRSYLEELLLRHGFEHLSIHPTSISHMTIEAKDASKKTAVDKLLTDYSDITFCCDGGNDLELARHIRKLKGHVVCPSNAIDDIKAIATFIASKPHGAGICEYLETLLNS